MQAIEEKGAALIQRLRDIGMEKREPQHHKTLKRASVLIPLLFFRSSRGSSSSSSYDDDYDDSNDTNDNDFIPHVLLTRRSMKLRSHPGHAAYPGGKQDLEDKNDDVATALREANEEVGINPEFVDILCRQPTLESINHLCVTPIVGVVTGIDQQMTKGDFLSKLVINQDEVDEVFVIPLSYFLQPPDDQYDIDWRGETFVYRKYIYKYTKESDETGGIESRTAIPSTFEITGLTAHMSYEVAKIALRRVGPPSASALSATSTNTSNLTTPKSERTPCSIKGYLWRLEEVSPSAARTANRKAAYWRKGYFVTVHNATSIMLHQYDSIEQATMKSSCANKKHRLPLHDCQLTTIEATNCDKEGKGVTGHRTSTREDNKYEFQIAVLGGRLKWNLAASSDQERRRWIGYFQSTATSTSED